jgi:predicted Ser/Thr protein kinase
MKENGLCRRGILPQFYGTMERLDPASFDPYLYDFKDDPEAPDAVLLKYVQGAEPLSMDNYSKPRMDKFAEYLREIHSLLITHGDIRLRNMWIFPESQDRVMWIDFNRAQCYEKWQLLAQQKNREIRDEKLQLAHLGRDLVRSRMLTVA